MATMKSQAAALAKQHFYDERLVGIYIGPFAALLPRAVISIFAGGLLASIMLAIDIFAGTELIGTLAWLGLTTVFAIYVAWTEEKVTVPVNHVAFVTFFGRRRHIYLREGDYYWIGRRFFFGISRTPLPNAKNVAAGEGEEQGFVFVGNRTLQIWNSRQNKVITLTLPSRAGSTVTTNLTLKITIHDPMKWALSDDPILQIAEQARAGLRKALTFFRDTDVSGAKSAVVALISGKRVLTSFTTKKQGSYLVGTMVQDQSGLPMYEVVNIVQKIDEDDEAFARREATELQQKREEFTQKVKRDGNPKMVEVAKDAQGNLIVATLNIEEKLNTVIAEVGSYTESVVISDAQLSQIVREASEKAASEGAQREQQITSAQTQSEVVDILASARQKNGVTELDQLIAAAADGNQGVHITHISGSNNPIVQAAVAAANNLKGKL